jgi:hypothetical protein
MFETWHLTNFAGHVTMNHAIVITPKYLARLPCCNLPLPLQKFLNKSYVLYKTKVANPTLNVNGASVVPTSQVCTATKSLLHEDTKRSNGMSQLQY